MHSDVIGTKEVLCTNYPPVTSYSSTLSANLWLAADEGSKRHIKDLEGAPPPFNSKVGHSLLLLADILIC